MTGPNKVILSWARAHREACLNTLSYFIVYTLYIHVLHLTKIIFLNITTSVSCSFIKIYSFPNIVLSLFTLCIINFHWCFNESWYIKVKTRQFGTVEKKCQIGTAFSFKYKLGKSYIELFIFILIFCCASSEWYNNNQNYEESRVNRAG